MNHTRLRNLVLAAFFLALGFVLPMLTGQIPSIGKMLLPMHIPVFLCGLICGWKYGGIVGFTLPLLRSLIFSVPVMYPTAIAVAFEMAVYGIVAGLLFARTRQKRMIAVYLSMFPAMLLGRLVRCLAEIILLGLQGGTFVFQVFFSTTIVNAVPGILLQLFLVPAVMTILIKTNLLDSYIKNNE